MVRVTFRVFGKDGHIECVCEDRTITNEFVDVVITADSFKQCANELNSKLSDGIFETCTVGKISIVGIEAII